MTHHNYTLSRRRWLINSSALLAVGGLAACGGGHADPRLDLAVQQARQRCQQAADRAVAAGLVGAVFGQLLSQPDDTLPLAAAGRSALQQGRPLDGSERFGIGSNAKAMTAALAARLVEQGKLRWDSRAAELLKPELLHPDHQDLTLAQLLDHKGAILPFNTEVDPPVFLAYLQSHAGPLPSDEGGRRLFFCRWLLAQPAPQGVRPGRDFLYSNAGFAMAGAMLEAATGQRFTTLFEQQLCQPLGLAVAWAEPDPAKEPQGHVGDSAQQLQLYEALPAEQQLWFDVLRPAGGVRLAGAEYGRWLRWHMQALQGRSTPLAASYLQRLKTLTTGDYALGWAAATANGQAQLGHNGAEAGFMAAVTLRQDGSQAAFTMSNTFGWRADGSSWVLEALNQGLLGLL
ncbi:serine hydrolase domain-containing protein [Paucibacter sp. APW11]|uniref:Serine hydrolase domain-containing protein n=1 Tax=Roseateles aquae TaxID=3077235 RepID=A0ABU3PE43_9BURK|nr:serine hydrolase domain-containing protein [Paucibacter sp. APW11]MDT9000870.1 serine hydrolase domain-containing protein [Paucibacter sp. APW11]